MIHRDALISSQGKRKAEENHDIAARTAPGPKGSRLAFKRNSADTDQSTGLNTKSRSRSRWGARILLPLFMVSLCVPIIIYVGTLRLSPYRLILILTVLPMLALWLFGRVGRKHVIDFFIIAHSAWAALALIVAHGASGGLEPAGIYAIEMLGAYFLARYCIQNPDDFRRLAKISLYILLFLIPFALVESLTSTNVLLDQIISSVFPTFGSFEKPQRWGLYRAMVVFEHPILYGVFCASLFGLTYYLVVRSRYFIIRAAAGAPSVFATFFSLSGGPLVALVVQLYLVIWDILTRWVPGRWWILLLLVVAGYIFVDLASNRSPAEVFISYFTFNQANAYNRIWIWYYGTAEVAQHPVFGIGLNDWDRAYWMSASMDNYWLALAVRYGLPALVLFLGAIIWTVLKLSGRRFDSPFVRDCRKAWCITLVGFIVAGATVHYWNAVFCLFIFMIGSGVWMLNWKTHFDNVSS